LNDFTKAHQYMSLAQSAAYTGALMYEAIQFKLHAIQIELETKEAIYKEEQEKKRKQQAAIAATTTEAKTEDACIIC
jgi:hypothetical protein